MPRIARAAEYSLKYGNNLPLTHPLNIRAQEAADRVAKESNGRVEIAIFPNNQLGGDTDMLAQVRNGAINFFTPSALVVATLVPVAAINAVGFALPIMTRSGRRWTAASAPMSAPRWPRLGSMPSRRCGTTASARSPAAPSRSRGAKDMDGLKIRVPVSPLSISMFKALAASPTSLQFSEVCSSLQTRIVDAQENRLPIIQVAKLYEVQKYCAISNHVWDGFWFVANARAFQAMPADLGEDRLAYAINGAGLTQRDDIKAFNATVQADLQGKGLTIHQARARLSFRAKLRDGGFCGEWKGRFGEEA